MKRTVRPDGLPTELYTTEAGESRRRAVADQVVPDPKAEDAEKAIEKHIVTEDDGDPD